MNKLKNYIGTIKEALTFLWVAAVAFVAAFVMMLIVSLIYALPYAMAGLVIFAMLKIFGVL